MNPLDDLGSFLAHAVVLEDEAATRYDELADAMAAHNNSAVEAVFRQMAGYSRMHRSEAVVHARAHIGGLPDLKPWEFHWPGDESPESGRLEASHYLMTPYHALRLALEAEHTARDFYAGVLAETRDAHIRNLAREFTAEETEHAKAIEQWIKQYPPPPEGWDEDLDPPVQVD